MPIYPSFINVLQTEPYVLRADQFFQQKRYAETISECMHFLDHEPSASWAYFLRGRAYYHLGEYARSIADFSQAIDTFPSFIVAYLYRTDEDASVAEHELRYPCDLAKLYYWRGQGHGAMGHTHLAIADYSQTIERQPHPLYTAALIARGLLYTSDGNCSAALADLNCVIAAQPRSVDAYLARAICRRQSGDLPSALHDCTAAIRYSPTNARAYLLRAGVNAELRHYDDAIADCSSAIQHAEDSLEAYLARAALYEQIGRLTEALADYGVALTHCQTPLQQAACHQKRASCYRALGDLACAQDALAREAEIHAAMKLFERGDDRDCIG